ncbi:hypothetical protein [Bacillus paranthracis]|nr:hypothetical protein [Bacillus paranthracis]
MEWLISLLNTELDFSKVHWGYWAFLFVACILNIVVQFLDEDDFK